LVELFEPNGMPEAAPECPRLGGKAMRPQDRFYQTVINTHHA
jgi:hypothetical protein